MRTEQSASFEEFIAARGQALQRFAYLLTAQAAADSRAQVPPRPDRPIPVGIPGSSDSQAPQLEIAGPVTTPTRFVMAVEISSQGPSAASAPSNARGKLAFVARCFGDAPLRLQLPAPSGSSSLRTIPCDDHSHVLRTAVTIRRGQNIKGLMITTSQLTSYRIAIGVIK